MVDLRSVVAFLAKRAEQTTDLPSDPNDPSESELMGQYGLSIWAPEDPREQGSTYILVNDMEEVEAGEGIEITEGMAQRILNATQRDVLAKLLGKVWASQDKANQYLDGRD